MPDNCYLPSDCYESGSVTFYDGIGRDVEDVDYGHEQWGDATSYLVTYNVYHQPSLDLTNGIPTRAESAPPAPNSTSNPNASTDYLVSQTVYNAPTPAGQAIDTIDNAGIDDRTIYDPEGRVTRTIQDYTGSGDFSGGIPAAGDTGKDVTTDYKYDSAGRLAVQVAYDAKGTTTVAEQTTYLYDCATDASLPTAVVAPDSTDTLTYNATTRDWTITSGTDHTSTAYDWLGRETSTTDQRGVTHTYSYDSAGRLAADTVTNFGNLPAAAQAVDEIATTYDDVGRVQTVTSYGSGQTVVNQVKEAYNGWGDLSREWQSPTGVVTGSTPSVQYDYADGSQGSGVAAYLRLTDVIYPNGRDVQYGYGTAGSTDDVLGQVATIAGSDGTYAAYAYLGLDTIVTEDYQQPEVKLDYTNGSGQITGLDRFGRVVDQVWTSYGQNSGDLGTLDGYSYTYDADGNVLSRINAVDSAMSEFYRYNGLDELTDFQRGTSQASVGYGANEEQYGLDALGNFSSVDDNGTTQTRAVDAANQITSNSGGTVNYDLAGNMTIMPQPGNAVASLTCVYDAWDRLVQVSIGGTVTAQYQYDGADRLVSETASGTTTYSFYAGQSVIETRTNGIAASNVKYQYVWSLRGDAIPILRDTYSGGTLQSASRIYYTTDANSNVTALIGLSSGTWIVIERYVYDPYGTVTIYNSLYTTDVGGYASSTVGNTLFFAGLSVDPATGLQHADFRWYNSALATWTAEDPAGSAGSGSNLYCYCQNNPTLFADPLGLYDIAGHFWTTYLIAIAAGYQATAAFELAYYSQLPDQKTYTDAVVQGVAREGGLGGNTWNDAIQNWLHSLHGGRPADVRARRACLRKLLQGKCGALKPWEMGFVIHALGDAYAHVDANGNAYPTGWGHTSAGHWPDAISNNFAAYEGFIRALYDDLAGAAGVRGYLTPSGAPADPTGLLTLLIHTAISFREHPIPGGEGANELAWEEAVWGQMAISNGYSNPYRPTSATLPSNMWKPLPNDVAALINKMRACCGDTGPAIKVPDGPGGTGTQLNGRCELLQQGANGVVPPK